MHSLRKHALCLLRNLMITAIFLIHTDTISSQEVSSRSLMLSDRTMSNAELLELMPDSRFRMNLEGKSTSFSFGDVCRWGVHPIPRRFPMAILVDGSCIAITSMERRSGGFVLKTNAWESIDVPESMLRAVIVAPTGSPEAWFELLDRVSNATGRNDQLLLGSRGWIDGILQWPDATSEMLQPEGKQKLRINSEDVIFAVQEIEAMVFSPVLTPILGQRSSGRIGWKDGSVLACSQWRIVQPGDYVELTLRCGIILKSLDQPALVTQSIVSLSHFPPGTRFLSDMEAASYKHVDWLTTKWPLAKDRDLWGRRLMIPYQATELGVVEKGLAMHATSQAAYRWDKSAGQLLSSVSLAPSAEPGLPNRGQAIAKVMGLKNGALESLYASSLLTAESAPESFSISLEGIELIVLIVDAGPGGTLGDHVLWLDTRIQK